MELFVHSDDMECFVCNSCPKINYVHLTVGANVIFRVPLFCDGPTPAVLESFILKLLSAAQYQ